MKNLRAALVVIAVSVAVAPVAQANLLENIMKEALEGAGRAAGDRLEEIIRGEGTQGASPERPPQGGNTVSAQKRENRQVQSALNAFGFPAGVVDGDLGPRSRGAIETYQRFMQFPITGQLTPYQTGILLEGHARLQGGEGAAFPRVFEAEGTKGLLKVVQNPAYAQRYPPTTYDPPTDEPPGGDREIGPEMVGVTPVIIDDLPNPEPVLASLDERCELVVLMTQTNDGMIQATTMSDPDQALSEQFCEARSFAISAGTGLAARIGIAEASLAANCLQIADALAPARALVASAPMPALQARVAEIKAQINLDDVQKAEAYGQLCTGLGYRQDNAEIALSGAMLSFAAGQTPYAELLAHHLREGFGLRADPARAAEWYDIALNALEQGTPPVFLPSKSPQRVGVMRAAIKHGQLQAQAGTVRAGPAAMEGGIPDLVLPQ